MDLKRQLVVVILGRLVTACITLASLRIATAFLTPEHYGVLALLVSIQSFFGLFLINPVGQHINLHTHAWWDDGSLSPRLKSFGGFVLVVSIIGGIAAVITIPKDGSEPLPYVFIAIFSLVAAGTWNATLVPMLNMLGFRTDSVIYSVLSALISLIFGVLFISWMPTATFWVLGQSVGMLLGALGAGAALRKHINPNAKSATKLPLLNSKDILGYCVPIAIANGFMWLQLSGYRFEITHFWGLTQLGYIAIGLQIAGQIGGLVEALASQFLFPMFYRRCSQNDNKDEVSLALSDLANTLAPLYVLLVGAIIAGGPYLIRVLVSANYHNAVDYVVFGAFIELFRLLANLFGISAHIMRRIRFLAAPYAVGAICSLLLLALAGLWQLPARFAVFSLLAGSCVTLFGMWIYTRQYIKLAIDWRRWLIASAWMIFLPLTAHFILPAAETGNSIVILVLIGIASVPLTAIILYKNPAAIRLINVDVRKTVP